MGRRRNGAGRKKTAGEAHRAEEEGSPNIVVLFLVGHHILGNFLRFDKQYAANHHIQV